MLFRSLNNFGRFGGLWSSQGGLSKMGSNWRMMKQSNVTVVLGRQEDCYLEGGSTKASKVHREREDLVDEHIFFHFVCDRCSLRRQEDNHLVEHKCFPKFHQIAAERQSPKGWWCHGWILCSQNTHTHSWQNLLYHILRTSEDIPPARI
jgi:hypothetical protein